MLFIYCTAKIIKSSKQVKKTSQGYLWLQDFAISDISPLVKKKIARIANRRVLNIPDVGVNMHNVTSVVPKRFDILWKSYIVLDVP